MTPHHDVEPAVLRRQRALARRRPPQPVGAEHEERDRVEPIGVDEHRGLAVEEVADRAALEGEVGVAFERHDGREVQPPLEPGLHLVETAALDLERARAREHAQVIVHRLGHHRGPDARGSAGGPLDIEDGGGHQPDGQHGERRDEPGPPPGPARAGRGRDRPASRDPALQRERGRVLRQLVLEHGGQLPFHGAGVRTGRTALEMGADRLMRGRRQAPLLVVVQRGPDGVAVHRALPPHRA